MNKKFQPASTEAFPLGHIGENHFVVNVSRKSCFAGFETFTPLPCLHLVVTIEGDPLTWDDWRGLVGNIGSVIRGLVGNIGSAINVANVDMREIVEHFFGEELAIKDAGWQFELNSSKAAGRQTVHFHLEIGHKDLFGEDGLVRQCVQSALKPNIIGEQAVTAFITEREQVSARALMKSRDSWKPSDGIVERELPIEEADIILAERARSIARVTLGGTGLSLEGMLQALKPETR